MNWRLKCAAFYALHYLPGGRKLHSLLQRKVTHRYFMKLTESTLAAYGFHVGNFTGGVALEFGAGRNLLTPLLLSHAGATRIYAMDLDRLATVEQVNAMIGELREKVGGAWPQIGSFADLETQYRVNYLAPGDARATGLPDASVDFVCSTSTLEHIPAVDIRAILAECRRILKPIGRMSFIIDYHDHYGSDDPGITRWNFYRYSAREWPKYNPPNHFQNRLRHSDHEKLFRDAGLNATVNRRIVRPWAEQEFARTKVCADFAYSRDDLLTTNGYFVLTR